MAAQRIKVSRDALLERVRAARAEYVEAHARALDEYNAANAGYADSVVEALEKALSQARNGKGLPPSDTRYLRGAYRSVLSVPGPRKPEKPSGLNLARFDKDIALLEMAADDTLMVSVDGDFGRYL